MTYSIGTSYDTGPIDRRYLSRETAPHAVSGAVALTLSVVVGGWILYARSVGMLYTPPVALNFDTQPIIAPAVVAPPPVASVAAPVVEATPYGTLAPAPVPPLPSFAAQQALEGTPAAIAASDGYVGLFDPTYSLGSTPASLAHSSPLLANFQPMSSAEPATLAENVQPVPTPSVPQQLVQDVPLPARRPPEFVSPASRSPTGSLAREMTQQQNDAIAASAPPTDQRSFFQKLFGRAQPSGPVLAYASAEDGAEEQKAGMPLNDHSTAVYDISAHTVYLPDGTRLEAHSGLGDALDDPRYVAERMRGPTPPGTYELQPREQLFHGVQALRLIPVGDSDVYGRAGLLAHTYMLGQNGDSFGCVSFKDYTAFLHAYESGEIKRITVVARLN